MNVRPTMRTGFADLATPRNGNLCRIGDYVSPRRRGAAKFPSHPRRPNGARADRTAPNKKQLLAQGFTPLKL